MVLSGLTVTGLLSGSITDQKPGAIFGIFQGLKDQRSILCYTRGCGTTMVTLGQSQSLRKPLLHQPEHRNLISVTLYLNSYIAYRADLKIYKTPFNRMVSAGVPDICVQNRLE